jgi:hypothetical protein
VDGAERASRHKHGVAQVRAWIASGNLVWSWLATRTYISADHRDGDNATAGQRSSDRRTTTLVCNAHIHEEPSFPAWTSSDAHVDCYWAYKKSTSTQYPLFADRPIDRSRLVKSIPNLSWRNQKGPAMHIIYGGRCMHACIRIGATNACTGTYVVEPTLAI